MSKRDKRKQAQRFKQQREEREEAAADRLRERMSAEHLDVLQNIEFTLVRAHRADRRIDDGTVLAALEAALAGTTPAGEPAAQIVADLTAVRRMREDVPDELWHDGLRVIINSVRLHSSLSPGSTAYLSFVAPFVP